MPSVDYGTDVWFLKFNIAATDMSEVVRCKLHPPSCYEPSRTDASLCRQGYIN